MAGKEKEKIMSGLGVRYKCYKCQTKFYDLAAPQPICPACGENQNNDQSRKIPPKQKKKVSLFVTKDIVIPQEHDGAEEMMDANDEKAYTQAVDDMENLTNEHDDEGEMPKKE
jgi:hypothetical protein